ncbi:deoxyribonuclease TATDN1-like protein [Vairimorpha necatrix]|uniref:Deoxyribonuclease TATDN1-like protein n=1 Tax=Vairimorpha necatrix TaxID=6039 RepID=A0AAX4J863_9MICR
MLIDISCNITEMKDIDKIIENSKIQNIVPIFVGLDYQSSLKSLFYAEKYKTLFYGGIHPLHSKDSEFIPLTNDRLIAVGECGLDYFRLEYSPVETQREIFKKQLDYQAERYFLHSRDAHRDLMEILSDYSIKGIVHSFTGTVEECKELVKKGYFVGINGCSVKTEEGLEVVRNLPLDRLLIETDSPYCKIRKSYAGFKYIKNYTKQKSNEPGLLREVLEVVGGIKGIEEEELEEIIYKNNKEFFGEKIEEVVKEWAGKA